MLARLAANRARVATHHPRRIASDWLLSSVAVCGYCADAGATTAPLCGLETARGRWYRCKRAEHPATARRLFPAGPIEAAVLRFVAEQLDAAAYAPLLAALQERAAADDTARRAEAARLATEAARLGRQATELGRALADGYSPTLRAQLTAVERQLTSGQQRLLQLHAAPVLTAADVTRWLAAARRLITEETDVRVRRRGVAALLSAVRCYAGRLVIDPASPVPSGAVAYVVVPPAGSEPKATTVSLPGDGRRAAYLADLLRDRDAGMTYAALGRKYGMSPQRAQRAATRARARGA